MQISLADKDKCSMLFLGNGLNFTYDEPGPVEVDLNTLTPDQRTQVYYHWKRGVLSVSDEDQLKSIYQQAAPPPAKSYATTTVIQNEAQPVTQPQDIDEALKARTARLKTILRKKINAIKRDLHTLSGVELLELVELEKQTKNRQKLIELLNSYIIKTRQDVSKSVGTEDVGKSIFVPNAQALDNSLDVVESEMEDVTLIPSDKELAKDHG